MKKFGFLFLVFLISAAPYNNPYSWWCFSRDQDLEVTAKFISYYKNGSWYWRVEDICVPLAYKDNPSGSPCQGSLLDLFLYGSSKYPSIYLNTIIAALLYKCGDLYYFVPLGNKFSYDYTMYAYYIPSEDTVYFLKLVFTNTHWVYDSSNNKLSAYGSIKIYDATTGKFLGNIINSPDLILIFF